MPRRKNQTERQGLRCAVYTRVSTSDEADKDYSSLEAQRETGEAYIAAQKHAGWECLPDAYDDEHAAPLLCAGLIGHRAYRMAGPAQRIGIYGFGAAAHIVAQVALHQGREVFAFARPGDADAAPLAEAHGAWKTAFDAVAAAQGRQAEHHATVHGDSLVRQDLEQSAQATDVGRLVLFDQAHPLDHIGEQDRRGFEWQPDFVWR